MFSTTHDMHRFILNAIEENGEGVLDLEHSNYSDTYENENEYLVVETTSGYFRIKAEEIFPEDAKDEADA